MATGSLIEVRRLPNFLTGFDATCILWIVKHRLILSVSMADRLLYRKKPGNKTKNEEHERRGLAILPYLAKGSTRVARWPAFHRPGRYFTANSVEAGKRPVF